MTRHASPGTFIGTLFCALLLTSNAQAEPLPLAHEASPDRYQMLEENDRVLVLKMVLTPGQSDTLHRHHAETVYFEQGGTLQIEPWSDGAFAPAMEATVPDGHVMWHDAWAHRVTNIGDTTVIAIIVEQK